MYSSKNKRNQYLKFISATLLVLLIGIGVFLFLKRGSISKEKRHFSTEYSFIIQGIDISHHNYIPEWKTLEIAGIDFVYIKATEGTDHEDTNYTYNYKASEDSNIRVGAYHFYTFGVSGREQAKHFINISQLKSGDLIPAIDVEHSPINPYSTDKEYRTLVVQELKILENELYKHYGVRPLMYANRECYDLYIKDHFADNLLWLVDLNEPPQSEIENWRIWQFSHKGRIPGVEGHIDLNYYRYTTKEFKELLLP